MIEVERWHYGTKVKEIEDRLRTLEAASTHARDVDDEEFEKILRSAREHAQSLVWYARQLDKQISWLLDQWERS